MVIYVVGFTLIWALYLGARYTTERRSRKALSEAKEAGLTEPPTLHPVVDLNRCIGCGTCVHACPEHDVLGLIGGKSTLINPASCIGHGACKTACPQEAITLVFGTEKRGVDIPYVQPNFETNVPGIFIAGELGGMGLIKNAINQGQQALDSIVANISSGTDGDFADVLIIGAGPAGIAATLGAHNRKLKYVTVEQDSLGGTVSHFPRGKIVMTAPVNLPMVGKVRLTETTKEALMELWEGIVAKTGIRINDSERVDGITAVEGGFKVDTTKQSYKTKAVLLAIGRRGTPRKLGVEGEELPKVVYRLTDPRQYAGKHVLVVGGGDSALEAAISIAQEPDTTVHLSYRSEAFSRAKLKNRRKVEEEEARGALTVLFKSGVKKIESDKVSIEYDGADLELQNDAVIVCAGGILPTSFLKSIGIEIETKKGTE